VNCIASDQPGGRTPDGRPHRHLLPEVRAVGAQTPLQRCDVNRSRRHVRFDGPALHADRVVEVAALQDVVARECILA